MVNESAIPLGFRPRRGACFKAIVYDSGGEPTDCVEEPMDRIRIPARGQTLWLLA